MNLKCKPTFHDCEENFERNLSSKELINSLSKHHWIYRWKIKGRCQHCSKSFQQKMFRDKVKKFSKYLKKYFF